MTETATASTAQWDVVVARDMMVPLRDGVRLATDIYLPARGVRPRPGPVPLILVRTPYDKKGSAQTGEFYARRGYAFAAQDVRGRYASEGTFYAFAEEGIDGFDTVEYLADQDWCDGRIGTEGASYCAAAQSALACLAPPHLSAMVVQFGPSSYYHSSMRHNGVLELRFLVYAFSMAASSREAAASPRIRRELEEAVRHVWEYVDAAPLRPGATPLCLIPSYERWAMDIQTHALYDDYWRRPGYGPMPHLEAHADVPTLYIGGWYDTYTRGTAENFVAMSRRQSRAVHLLLGPWHHGGAGEACAGQCDFGQAARLDLAAVRLRWFDHWLKGVPTGLDAAAPVRYFRMGGGGCAGSPGRSSGAEALPYAGEWREASTWPPPGRLFRLYLRGDGSLCPTPPGAEDGESRSTYTYDPADPVPTVGGNLSAMPLPAGGYHQRGSGRGTQTLPLAARRDVLTFHTPPLQTPVDIAGPVRARLFVCSDCPDTDFTVKLVDQFPRAGSQSGETALNLTDSIGRLRFREGFDRECFVEP
ncbi:MAG: CocE/NonD family hydrolase, partial [Lentisphaeria bacterium]|nr:CocE/NonD family hydrolase [Lentisphaeria bacterium]